MYHHLIPEKSDFMADNFMDITISTMIIYSKFCTITTIISNHDNNNMEYHIIIIIIL